MEQLNSKLYAKYNDLKKRKTLVDEEWNQKRISDISDFQSAVEVVEDLKNENDRLRAEMDLLQEQYVECKEELFEECRKTKQLSDEVGKLQNLSQRNVNGDSAMRRSVLSSPRVVAHASPIVTRGLARKSASKSCTKETEMAHASPIVTRGLARKSASKSCTKETEIQTKEFSNVPHDNCPTELVVPDCCRRSITSSGEATGKVLCSCLFQTLLELLLGIKFSVDHQSEGPCLLAVHEMSGYTFTLTWLRHEDGGEGELRYHVSSLGTLERVASEWMKEDIVFSTRMWPVFFERVSRVIGRR